MRVFINYKSAVEPDDRLASALQATLENRRYNVFRDDTIEVGEEWPKKIEREIQKCNVVVSLVSCEALRSQWVLREIDYARGCKRIILPVLLDDLEELGTLEAFQTRLQQYQWMRYSGDADESAREIAARLDSIRRRRLYRRLRFLGCFTAVLLAVWMAGVYLIRPEEPPIFDAENPHWPNYGLEHDILPDDGPAQFTLDDAVRLAALGSPFYRKYREKLRQAGPGGGGNSMAARL
ncbi:MAG: toll/interleukin-1 receptor domain-containing protein [Planctomycetes bacterium]|nr:toll/interleukin-1 receptor domain-containing protein [Planctomycetota bacterium]